MQTLQITDFEKIKPFLDAANYKGYNSNFVTMMMWNHEYHVQYEIHDAFVVMLQEYQGTRFFAMPFCKQNHCQEAIDYMLSYANQHGFPFIMDGVTEEMKQYIQAVYANTFLYEATPNNDDYIYEKQSLATLAGKKMQKRRNHYNAFIKNNPSFVYKEIEDQDIDQVLLCLRRWDQEHEDEESVQSEFVGIMYLLMHRHILPIKTGCIYIDGVLEAFIIGSQLKHHTVQIHVEKANKDIRGLYVAIGKYFLENNYLEDIYVNREEDMGIPALQKAKKDLHPIEMVHKYRLTIRNTTICQAKTTDKIAIQELWRECFVDEDEASTEFYFTYCYQEKHTYVLMQGTHIITAVQIVPYSIAEETVYFILGMCTQPTFQHNGCMKEMMLYVLGHPRYQNQRIFLQAYVPALYYPYGFHETYYQQKIEVALHNYHSMDTLSLQDITPPQQLHIYQQFCSRFSGYRKRDIAYYETYIKKRCVAFQEVIKGMYHKDILLGYIIYNEDEKTITISEILYLTQEYLDMMVSYFVKENKKVIVICDLQAKVYGEQEIFCNMLTNDSKNDICSKELFINEIY